MKPFIRSLVFVLISLYFLHNYFPALLFESSGVYFLFAFALALLLLYLKPLTKLVGFGTEGVVYFALSVLLTFAIINVLVVFLPAFSVRSIVTPKLIILGFVIPSRNLSGLGASALSSLVINAGYTFLDWLCTRKK